MNDKNCKNSSVGAQSPLYIGCDQMTNITAEKVVINQTINIPVANRRSKDEGRLLRWLKALGVATAIAIAVYKLFTGLV